MSRLLLALCIALLAVACQACPAAIAVETNPFAFKNANEMLQHNVEVFCRGINAYKKQHHGNAPRDLQLLVDEGILTRLPINPVTGYQEVNVSLYSDYLAGNYTYMTYPFRRRDSVSGTDVMTVEYLLIQYHDGTGQDIGDYDYGLGNSLLDTLSSKILWTEGEIISTRQYKPNVVTEDYPTLEELLDYNGYIGTTVHVRE